MKPPTTPPTTRSLTTSRADLTSVVRGLLDQDYRCLLVSGHDDGPTLRVVYAFARAARDSAGQERVEVVVAVPADDAWVPSLASLSYPIGRFEREVRDMLGIEPRDHPLPHRLVHHAHWPDGWHPLRQSASVAPEFDDDVSAFPFLEVQGDGVYEIPVGPVHAGMIEPGHFRFSVVGETIVRMKARLWYVHRGVERLFEGRDPRDGIDLAERISGDTAVGHTLAYVLACEEALGHRVGGAVGVVGGVGGNRGVGEDAQLLRAMLLELERLYNHVGDLGAILNDIAFGIAHSHTQAIRESLLRLNAQVTGHRLLRGAITVGATTVRELPDLPTLREAAGRVAEVVAIALDHPMVLDRLTGPAVLRTEDARRMGVLGYVARASGVDVDARRDHPFVDLGGPAFVPVVETAGDVLARFTVRAREVQQSVALVESLVERLDGRVSGVSAQAGQRDGPRDGQADDAGSGGSDSFSSSSSGLGVVEAWRGLLCHRVEIADGVLTRVKVVDPSFMNWPALPVCLADTIVPDFPLANKSFNQSYAGNDL